MGKKSKAGLVWLLTVLLASAWPASAITYGEAAALPREVTVHLYDNWAGDRQVPVLLEKGKMLVPLRVYANALGFSVFYDAKTKQTTVSSLMSKLVLKVGSKYATVNGQKRTMSVPLRNVSGSMWISLDWMTEIFPATLDGYDLTPKELYYRQKVNKDEWIIDIRKGDLFLAENGGLPQKAGTLHPGVSMMDFKAERTAFGNYYVEVTEFRGDTVMDGDGQYTALYIRDHKTAVQDTPVSGSNIVHRFGDEVVITKGDSTLFIDDKTGQTVRTVPVTGLVDLEGKIWVGNGDKYFVYDPDTNRYLSIVNLLDEKDRLNELSNYECPTANCHSTKISYVGREGDKIIFMFDDKQRIVYDPAAQANGD